jgi:hypothetical protein
VDPWIFELNPYLTGCAFTALGIAYDPGSDDVTFTWTYSGQPQLENTFLNGDTPDIYTSPFTGIAPVVYVDEATFVYIGSSQLTLMVQDDDEGQPTDPPGTNSVSLTLV